MIRREKTHTYNDLQCISNVKISTMWYPQAISLFIDPMNTVVILVISTQLCLLVYNPH